NSAWASVRFARESRRANPRGYLGTRRTGPHSTTISSSAKVGYEDILERVDEGISHLRNLTRTLAEASYDEGRWDDRFRAEWADIAADAGRAVADPDADVEPIHARRDELSTRLAHGVPRRVGPARPRGGPGRRRSRRRCRADPRTPRRALDPSGSR